MENKRGRQKGGGEGESIAGENAGQDLVCVSTGVRAQGQRRVELRCPVG